MNTFTTVQMQKSIWQAKWYMSHFIHWMTGTPVPVSAVALLLTFIYAVLCGVNYDLQRFSYS